MINNVKSSHIIQCDVNWKKYLLERADSLNFSSSQRGNILIVKKNFNLCIFERKDRKPCNDTKNIHINLSGVENLSKTKIVLDFVLSEFFSSSAKILNSKIDNITASFTYPGEVNISFLKSINQDFLYNKERFPGLFIKLPSGTAIIFNSGKINIIGSKTERDVLQTWRVIVKYLLDANMKIKQR
jgi:hypothetical protein